MLVSMIFACSDNGTLGLRNGIPWEAKEEQQQRFKVATRGKMIAIGRRTYESLPGKLPDRRIVVVSSRVEHDSGATWLRSLSDVLDYAKARNELELVVAGGLQLYDEAMPHCDVIYQSLVHVEVGGDVPAPGIDHRQFDMIWSRPVKSQPAFTYRTFVRRSAAVRRVDQVFGLLAQE